MSKPPNLDLVRSILDIALDELDTKPPDKVNMRSIAERAGSARDRLAALVRAYVEWCLERPNLARLLMEDLPPREELTEEKMRKYYAVFFAARDLIEEAVREGGL